MNESENTNTVVAPEVPVTEPVIETAPEQPQQQEGQ